MVVNPKLPRISDPRRSADPGRVGRVPGKNRARNLESDERLDFPLHTVDSEAEREAFDVLEGSHRSGEGYIPCRLRPRGWCEARNRRVHDRPMTEAPL